MQMSSLGFIRWRSICKARNEEKPRMRVPLPPSSEARMVCLFVWLIDFYFYISYFNSNLQSSKNWTVPYALCHLRLLVLIVAYLVNLLGTDGKPMMTCHIFWTSHQHSPNPTAATLESIPHSCTIFRGGRRMGCALMQPPQVTQEWGMLLHVFQRLLMSWKNILRSCFKNEGFMWPGAVLGSHQKQNTSWR